jgi:enoyl-CoA hydratase/carnithine racemase
LIFSNGSKLGRLTDKKSGCGAQELFLLKSRLTAQEALAFGLVSHLAPDHQVDSEAASLAANLAAGPTCAFGAVRRMLRQSFEDGTVRSARRRKGFDRHRQQHRRRAGRHFRLRSQATAAFSRRLNQSG